MIIQTNDSSFSRDTKNMALLNTNESALEKHMLQRKKMQSVEVLKEQVSDMQHNLADIQNDLSIIKTLIKKFLDKEQV